jgi:lactoylglutathione lyase
VSGLRLHHVALWVEDLERMRGFYVDALGGTCGPLYENERTGFRSYFIAFGEGRVELMWQGGRRTAPRESDGRGWVHVALSVGSREQVDAHFAALRERGTRIIGAPRVTGDGYYEAVVEDPEGNRIEIVA